MSAEAPPTKKSKKLLVIALAAVVLLGAAGGGAFWWMNKQGDDEEAHVEKKTPVKPSFTNLEPFTVNLRDDRGERFAQIGVTFQLDDPQVDTEIKDNLPAVRNNILLLISSKRIEDLLTPEGKQALAEEIRVKAGEALGVVAAKPKATSEDDEAAAEEDEPPRKSKSKSKKAKPQARENPIRAVLFSQFIVQ